MRNDSLNLASLSNLFADETAAREFFEARLWPDGPICPHCGLLNEAYRLKAKPGSKRPVRDGVWKCKGCRRQFTIRIGTIFEESHIPLRKWLMALHLMTSSKKGISSHQIAREVGITVKSAWFLTHRIRVAMRQEPLAGMLKGTVEADETYVGGKPRKGAKPKAKRGRGTKKAPVLALVERDGRVRVKPVERVGAKELKGTIRHLVDKGAKIVTDDFSAYDGIGKEFAGGHATVRHSTGEYVTKTGDHTNTAESFFALLKRGHYGTFHQLSKRHLHRYCDEFGFRWDYRKTTDGERMVEAIKGVKGKRLMYKQPIGEAG